MPRNTGVDHDRDRSLRRILITAMVVGFLLLFAAGVATWRTIQRVQLYNVLVDHTYFVEDRLNALLVALERSETARRGYMLTGDRSFRAIYLREATTLEPRLNEIRTLTLDNPTQTARTMRAADRMRVLDMLRMRSIEAVDGGATTSTIISFAGDRSVLLLRAQRYRIDAMLADEQQLLRERGVEQRAANRTFINLFLAAGALVLLVTLATGLTLLRYTADLARVRDRLRALALGLEDEVAERTADLTRANEEIQRFAYIVSHDLRSPLVNVMGFTAELEDARKSLSQEMAHRDAEHPGLVKPQIRVLIDEDLPEAIRFIRQSTQKMDRLINAILKLSREGRRVLTPEKIDMNAMAGAIRDTLAHMLDERGAELKIQSPLPAIESDRLAVEQVFGNVIENAVKYLDPARPGRIVVRGRAIGDRVLYEIEDNGRGIDPQDHQRVFDLFRRSGTQDQPGEGIGLAHVRALTYRLGGTIDVASELGRGATFRITLPASIRDLPGTTE